MTTKARIERLTQLSRASTGKETKRPVKDILASERSAAEKFIARPPATETVEQPAE